MRKKVSHKQKGKDMVNYRIGKLAHGAFSSAYRDAVDSGEPVLAVRKQTLYEICSDGSEKVVKKLPALVRVKKSQKVAL